MRFDPKLFRAADHDLDALRRAVDFPDELPDDLEFLGDQLSEEASLMARRYPSSADLPGARFPAKTSPSRRSEPAPRGRTWGLAGASRLAAAVLLVVAGTWGSLHWLGGPDAPDGFMPGGTLSPDGLAQGDGARLFEDEGLSPLIVPAGYFQSLSAPEQEALLDLMENEDADLISLSI